MGNINKIYLEENRNVKQYIRLLLFYLLSYLTLYYISFSTKL